MSFKNPFGYFGAVDQAQDRDMRDLGYSLGATDQRRVLIVISQIFNEHLLYAKYCARCQGHRNEKDWFLTLKEWTLYYETRQTSKQTKTLQYDVCFYGDVTLLRVFPEEEIWASADPFWAQGTVGWQSVHEASLANEILQVA